MANDFKTSSKRVLEPIERISEVLFGIIMVLTFTGTLSVAEAGRQEVRSMLIAALGCNFAWGLIDAIMYLMGCLTEQATRIRTVLNVRQAAQPDVAHRIIAEALPPAVAAALQEGEFEKIRVHLAHIPEPSPHPRLTKRDFFGAIGVFTLVFFSTIPVVIPFLFIEGATRALRLSNGIAILILFVTGCAFGRRAGYHSLLMGVVMVVLGLLLVLITIALGG